MIAKATEAHMKEAPEPIPAEHAARMIEFEELMFSLVSASGAEDRPRIVFISERIRARYLHALKSVRIGTIIENRTE